MNTPIRQIDVSAYTVPTESPESDGTLIWDSTTLVLVEAHAGGQVGIGYTYAAPAAGRLIRCAGITGFLQAGALCEAYGLPLSAHTAPSLHAPLCCALGRARHVEYFFDHARIEPMFFDVGIFEFEASPGRVVSGSRRPSMTRAAPTSCSMICAMQPKSIT